jgi:hypothetical protein
MELIKRILILSLSFQTLAHAQNSSEPLPKICESWKPPPPHRVLKPEEITPIPGVRMDLALCYEDGECFFPIQSNMIWFEENEIYLKGPDGLRTPNGGSSNFGTPMTAKWVTCHNTVNDIEGNQVEKVIYQCRGDIVCAGKKDCCHILERKKEFIKHEEPSEEQILQWEIDRCNALEERRRTCEPFCTKPEYSSQCQYWFMTCTKKELEGIKIHLKALPKKPGNS